MEKDDQSTPTDPGDAAAEIVKTKADAASASIPEVDSPPPEDLLAQLPPPEQVIKDAQTVEEVIKGQPSVDELLGRDR
jgi:hypothetical protein